MFFQRSFAVALPKHGSRAHPKNAVADLWPTPLAGTRSQFDPQPRSQNQNANSEEEDLRKVIPNLEQASHSTEGSPIACHNRAGMAKEPGAARKGELRIQRKQRLLPQSVRTLRLLLRRSLSRQ